MHRGSCSVAGAEGNTSSSKSARKLRTKLKPLSAREESASHVVAADLFPMSSEMKRTMAALGKLDLTTKDEIRQTDERLNVRTREKHIHPRERTTHSARQRQFFSLHRTMTQPNENVIAACAGKQRLSALSRSKSPNSRRLRRAHTVDFLPSVERIPRVENRMSRAHTIDAVTSDMKLEKIICPEGSFLSSKEDFPDYSCDNSARSSSWNWSKTDRDLFRANFDSRAKELDEIKLNYSLPNCSAHRRHMDRNVWENMATNRRKLLDKWLHQSHGGPWVNWLYHPTICIAKTICNVSGFVYLVFFVVFWRKL